MLTLDPSTLSAVVDQALRDAAAHPRWLKAIDRAVRELVSNPYLERGEHHALLIGSTSGACYSSNGVCQCTAYTGLLDGRKVHQGGQPCWHRAAARLVRLHDQANERNTLAAQRLAAYEQACAELDECFA